MSLRQMEVFRAVMREGSITGAARVLGISQPSVSEVLKHTEIRCGFQLFSREKGRLRPTENAMRIRDDVDVVFMHVSKVNRIVNEIRKARDVNLSLGCVYSLSLSLMPRVIARLYEIQPNLKPHIVAERRNDLALQVAKGIVAGAISFQSEVHPELEIRILRTGRPRFLCRKDHPLAQREGLTLADIAMLEFVGFMPHTTMFAFIEKQFRKVNMPFRSVLDVEQIVQAWALVQATHGVAIADPFCELGNLFPNVVSIEILDADLLPLQFLFRPDTSVAPVLLKLCDLLSRDLP